jgi:hypothetical protein
MPFEANQEGAAATHLDASHLLKCISPEEIRAFQKNDMQFAGKTCSGVLPDCTIDFGAGVADSSLYLLHRTDEPGVFSRIRERLFGSNHDDLMRRTDRAAEQEALSKLSPKERQQYEAEKRSLEEYERRQGSMMSLVPTGEKPPATPTMDKVHQQAQKIECAARQYVIEHMTPEERRQLEKEQKEFDAQSRRRSGTPYDATIYVPVPEPGPMMREVEKRTGNAIKLHV